MREKIQLEGLDGLKLYNMIADKKKCQPRENPVDHTILPTLLFFLSATIMQWEPSPVGFDTVYIICILSEITKDIF